MKKKVLKKNMGLMAPEMGEEEEVALLQGRIAEESPAAGTQATAAADLVFASYPLSRLTQQGLKSAKYTHPTDIQAAAIPHSLAGRDILGAAKTGSGKTLSYVVPILEKLYLERWSIDDGLAAVIIVPTRELGLQVFEVLRNVGRFHNFSAGLITGGKKEFLEEQDRVVRMNILIATPGRLLQHFEQTPGFDAGNLQLLVLDEADRVLDMGFKQQLDGILNYLPNRQTLLFSATQTKSVKDLARLSLRGAEYLAVHSKDEQATPTTLTQHYVVCGMHEKLDTLFSFIRTHQKHKMIVFFSTCAQARFVFDVFRAMQPGVPLVALHGKIKQERRTQIYMDFLKRSQACMFATDVAARGLDFPQVDWVLQLDAPEDTDMYIHRVGRTARNKASGRSLLLLLPQEERTLSQELQDAGIPVKKLTVNTKHTMSVATKAAALLAATPDFKLLAKKAFTSYLRSLTLQHKRLSLYVNKETGELRGMEPGADGKPPPSGPGAGLPLDAFASSLGLPFTPDIPTAPKNSKEAAGAGAETKKRKNVNRSLDKLKKQIKEEKEAKKKAREEAAKQAKKAAGGSDSDGSGGSDSDSDIDDEGNAVANDDDLLVVKKTHRPDDKDDDSDGSNDGDDASEKAPLALSTKQLQRQKDREKKPMRIDSDGQARASLNNKRTLFDEDGEMLPGLKMREGGSGEMDEDAMNERVRRVKARIDEGRRADTEWEKARIKDKHLKERQATNDKEEENERGAVATLGGAGLDSDSDGNSDSDEDDSDSAAMDTRAKYVQEEGDSDSDSGSTSASDEDNSPEALQRREEMALSIMNKLR
jgi:ATP-dependent RNA helicase DDX10/DBP4